MPYRLASSLFSLAFALTASSAALAQAASPISRASFIATMDSEYRKLDTNGDGIVTRVELEASQQRASVAALAQQARQLFAKIDTDRNGQLSLNEFVVATSSAQQQKPNVSPMMTRLDTNRDSKVTLVEYRTITLTGFDKMDTDKDGVVSVAEQRVGGLVK